MLMLIREYSSKEAEIRRSEEAGRNCQHAGCHVLDPKGRSSEQVPAGLDSGLGEKEECISSPFPCLTDQKFASSVCVDCPVLPVDL